MLTQCPTSLVYALLVHPGGTRGVMLTIAQVSSVSQAGLQRERDVHQLYDRVRKYHADSRDRGVLHTS